MFVHDVILDVVESKITMQDIYYMYMHTWSLYVLILSGEPSTAG